MENVTKGNSHMAGPPVCRACDKPIYEDTVFKVNGQSRHRSCLRCVVCNNGVKEYCHMRGNDIFCTADFSRLFGTKCASCSRVISPGEAACVTNGNAYHPSCHSCVLCSRKIETGAWFYVREDLKLICQRDYQRLQYNTATNNSESESDESGSDETFEHQTTSLPYEQQQSLENYYASEKRPPKEDRRVLCAHTGLSGRQIQLWFKNRRARDKRDNLCGFKSRQQTSEAIENQPSIWCSVSGTSHSSNTQAAYYPLDFFEPGSMPPNMDLCPSDFCDGEVITGKQNMSTNLKPVSSHIASAHYVTNSMVSNWLRA